LREVFLVSDSKNIVRGLCLLGAGLLLGLSSAACGPEESMETSGEAKASFEWGGNCESGTGSFAQSIPYRDTSDVGEIPTGKRGVRINLEGAVDVDVQLYDKATGTAIIAWPNGLLSGASEESTTYQGLSYRYSGYNGVDGALGHEFIEILGDTNRELVMRAYGYAAGQAAVTYEWEAVPTCNEKGSGSFQQAVPYRELVDVGTIPAGKANIIIELEAAYGRDVDIQLIDAENGHEIIAWPSGDLNGASQESLTYRDMVITYSGYNGIGGNWGHESIEIRGTTTVDLTMMAYGYAAGTANVDYVWGLGAGALCEGTTNPPLPPCQEGLTCKRLTLSLSQPGQCHTDNWCLNADMAFHHCGTMETPSTPGVWTCFEFQCQWRELSECETKGGVCTHWQDECPSGTYSESPMGCPMGRSGQCCLPFGAEIPLTRADDGTTISVDRNDMLVMDLDRGPVTACFGGHWQVNSLETGGVLRFISHEVVNNPDCAGIGCYHEMDRFRFVARDTGSPESFDFYIDQGDAPSSCENDKIGTFSLSIAMP